jgi:glucokinase
MTDILLALDYGGTKLSAAVTGRGENQWHNLVRLQSPPGKNARYDIEVMNALARQLLGDQKPAAIGVSFGGPVDAKRGRVILSHHIPGWEDVPLRDQLQATFGVPTSVDNDANVAALGEYHRGAGMVGTAHVKSLFYVTVSTGVGGGWVLDGAIWSGTDGMAGEIGHTIAQSPAAGWLRELPLCVCGRRGCVESIACGPAIAREARAILLAEPEAGAKLRSLIDKDMDAVTGEQVARAANEGDQLARRVMDQAAYALGFGIGTAITFLNPERVVVGGGVSKSGDRYLEAVRAAARSNTLPQMQVDIVHAALGDDAPLWGAVALAERVISDQ